MHGQLTGQPTSELRGSEADEAELRHGFSYGHVRALAWRAMRDHTPSWGMDRGDQFEAAWGAIVERLCAVSEPPTPLDLLFAGRSGLNRLRKGVMRERGYAYGNDKGHRDAAAGPMSARSFWRYWHKPLPPTPEEVAVDKAALWQIMAELEPGHAKTLLILADYGDHKRAAVALGLADSEFRKRLGQARAAFLVLWHEHEAPSKTWRQDHRPLALKSQPASNADAIRYLHDIRECFGERTRISGLELLARLAAADPARYGEWDVKDLCGFLRQHGAPRHSINIDGDRRNKRTGYWLEEVTSALQDLTSGDALALQAAASSAA